jgi:hypothetical protein
MNSKTYMIWDGFLVRRWDTKHYGCINDTPGYGCFGTLRRSRLLADLAWILNT